ncbi:hypothetical protein [Noviluteimonas gilva]
MLAAAALAIGYQPRRWRTHRDAKSRCVDSFTNSPAR